MFLSFFWCPIEIWSSQIFCSAQRSQPFGAFGSIGDKADKAKLTS